MNEIKESEGIMKMIDVNDGQLDDLLKRISKFKTLIEPIRQVNPSECKETVETTADSNQSLILSRLQHQYHQISTISEMIENMFTDVQL